MAKVRPKKHLGQHFLRDKEIAHKIVASLNLDNCQNILEIGPGMGILTSYLLDLPEQEIWVIDIDQESIDYLHRTFPQLNDRIIHSNFLKYDLTDIPKGKLALIGNLPYNISSQIFFRLLDLKNVVPEMVCMIQKEVAQRIASPPGNKTYGKLSVLLGAFFDIEYLFTVEPEAFNPPPKVDSAVIRLTRNNTETLACDEKLFFRVVKTAFNQRRKTMRNSLKSFHLSDKLREDAIFAQRPEQLSVQQFIELTKSIEKDGFGNK